MKRTLLAVLLLGATGACSDQSTPLAPDEASGGAAASVAVATPTDHLSDALERIAPALGESAEAADVRAALRGIIVQRGAAAEAPGRRRALEAALDRLEGRAPELAADIDAIRLALAADAAERMHKPPF